MSHKSILSTARSHQLYIWFPSIWRISLRGWHAFYRTLLLPKVLLAVEQWACRHLPSKMPACPCLYRKSRYGYLNHLSCLDYQLRTCSWFRWWMLYHFRNPSVSIGIVVGRMCTWRNLTWIQCLVSHFSCKPIFDLLMAGYGRANYMSFGQKVWFGLTWISFYVCCKWKVCHSIALRIGHSYKLVGYSDSLAEHPPSTQRRDGYQNHASYKNEMQSNAYHIF